VGCAVALTGSSRRLPHVERHKDIQNAERRRHHDTEVAGHERLRVIPHERCAALPGGTEWLSSTATLAAPGPADRARRHANPEPQEQFRRNPLFPPGDVVPSHGGDQPLELGRERWASRARPPAPEEAEGLSVLAEERARLDDREHLPPREAAREQNEREPHRRFSAAKAVRDRRLAPRNRTRSIASPAITWPT
jgi:hypothetical protein